MGHQQTAMLIGFDFDNTIACYDQAIIRLAEEIFDLPGNMPRTKVGLRDYLRHQGRELEWTAFQGELYGPGMRYAEPFEGAIETMMQLKAAGHEMVIVSHRSCRPYAGPKYDLHRAAHEWVKNRLKKNNLFENNQVHFLETREAKLGTIKRLGCNVFVDDLLEILNAPQFPISTLGILFNPVGIKNHETVERFTISRWIDLPDLLSQLG
jgi:FMN phosphatase YigB (HAD superfamily)